MQGILGVTQITQQQTTPLFTEDAMRIFDRLPFKAGIVRRIEEGEERLAGALRQVANRLTGQAKLLDGLDSRLYHLSLRMGTVEDVVNGSQQLTAAKAEVSKIEHGLTAKPTDPPLHDDEHHSAAAPSECLRDDTEFVMNEIPHGKEHGERLRYDERHDLWHKYLPTSFSTAGAIAVGARVGIKKSTVATLLRDRLDIVKIDHGNYRKIALGKPVEAPDRRRFRTKYHTPRSFYHKVGFDRLRRYIDVNSSDKWGVFLSVQRINDSATYYDWRLVFMPATLSLRKSESCRSKNFASKKEAEVFAYRVLLLHEAECLKRGCSLSWWLRVPPLESVYTQLEARKANIRGVE